MVKTTLASLIQNLYPLKTGKILIGDYDINYISNYSLRNLVSVVPQQIDLFSGNVIENIAIGEDFPDIQHILDITKKTRNTWFCGEVYQTDFRHT